MFMKHVSNSHTQHIHNIFLTIQEVLKNVSISKLNQRKEGKKPFFFTDESPKILFKFEIEKKNRLNSKIKFYF